MANRRKFLLFCVVLLLGGLALIIARPETDEPTFDGRTLSGWLEIYGRSSRKAPDREALAAITQIGTNSLPYLLKWTSYEARPPAVGDKIKSLVLKMPSSLTPGFLIGWASEDKEERRADIASVVFPLLGEHARLAIPGLGRLMNDFKSTNASARAVIALAMVGKDALPSLLATLADTNAPNRRIVASQIGMDRTLVTNATPAVPLLVQCLQDHDVRLRDIAAWSLWRIARDGERPPADQVVPALTNCLGESATSLLRVRAMLALGVYGDQARPAVPHLLKALTDYDREVRVGATNALQQIAPELIVRTELP